MAFISLTCGKCFHSYEAYQKRMYEAPPCPKCGYPELKTREQYLRASFGCAGCAEKCESRTEACDSKIAGGL